MSDLEENQDAPESSSLPESTGERLTSGGISSVQGGVAVRESHETYPDISYADAEGRSLTLRTYPSGDDYMVRVFDRAKTKHLPDHPDIGNAGLANLHIERDLEGRPQRAKLRDIVTVPGYRGSGTGGRMLEQCETIARRNGVNEVHGQLDTKEDEADEVQRFYEKRGYQCSGNGKPLSKKL